MIPLIPALSGALVVAGLLLAVWALIPRPESVGRPSTSWREGRWGGWWQRTDPRMRWALGAALSMGVVIATATGFVLAIVVLPLAVVGVPYLAASSPQARRIARLEGIAEWTRNLSGVLSVGVGLEQALIATLRSTPEAIRPEVGRLVARLHARWRTEPALRAFADDLDDATGDMVAGALILSSRRRGAGLAAVLTGLAETVAEDVTARRKVESDRAKPRQTARIVTGISVVALVALALSGTFMAPYATPLGQLVLAILLAAYAATLVWMRKMTQGKPLPRFLHTTPAERAVGS